jgi:mycofactocin system glycosyltransferase
VQRPDPGRILVGGDPLRATRLSRAGVAALARLTSEGAGPSPGERRLARTLVDHGIAHPRPARTVIDRRVTIVIPLRGPADILEHSLARASVPVIVVDDGSGETSRRVVADVCRRHGARLIRRHVAGGPAAARNQGLAKAKAPIIAFLDGDCIPEPDWLERLVGHFDDPLVAAVAPRITGLPPARGGMVTRFAAARSPLDLGVDSARVRPGGRVGYVPSAALLVRRAALSAGFDPSLRYGEDVDLVWRLHDAGWQIRYDPAVTISHREPRSLGALVARRFRYGTSAAPLARRHPGRLSPFIITPSSAGVLGLLAVRQPAAAVAVAAMSSTVLARRLARAGLPSRLAWRRSLRTLGEAGIATSRAATTFAAPLVLAGLAYRRRRCVAAALLVASPLSTWTRTRPSLDPIRWSMLSIADDAAYGAGVWAGAVRQGTPEVVRPILVRDRRSDRTGPAAALDGS